MTVQLSTKGRQFNIFISITFSLQPKNFLIRTLTIPSFFHIFFCNFINNPQFLIFNI